MRQSILPRPAAKSVSPLSVAVIVDALDDIRTELMTDRHGRAWTSARILTLMAELEAAALPRISGGCDECKDDREVACGEVRNGLDGWPAYDPELDDVRWTTESTPLSVLADDPAAAWEPSEQDWADYHAHSFGPTV